jgi:hypothetical protein
VLLKEPELTRLAANLLDEAVQEEFGDDYRDLRGVYVATGGLPAVDFVVIHNEDDDD